MTLKMKMIGAVLASALIGGVGQTKADEVRVDVRPGGAPYAQQPAPRNEGWRRGPEDRAPGFVRVADRGHGFRVARGEDASRVAREIRAEADRAAREVRLDVRRGTVEPRALSALESDRQDLERALAAASVNGVINARERASLEQRVQAMRDLQTQFRCARPAAPAYRR